VVESGKSRFQDRYFDRQEKFFSSLTSRGETPDCHYKMEELDEKTKITSALYDWFECIFATASCGWMRFKRGWRFGP